MSDLVLPRRQFLLGLAGMLAAPAIVHAENLMRIPVSKSRFIRIGDHLYEYATPELWPAQKQITIDFRIVRADDGTIGYEASMPVWQAGSLL